MTNTSRFDRDLLPPARTFYQQQFSSALGRERKGWALTKCPFHDGKSKTSLSLNLIDGHFCCFSCGVKGGDVLKFTMLLHNMRFRQATEFLGAVRDMDEEEIRRRKREKREADRRAARAAEQAETARQDRILAGDYLLATKVLYEEAQAEHDWLSMCEMLPRVREAEALYCRLAGIRLEYAA